MPEKIEKFYQEAHLERREGCYFLLLDGRGAKSKGGKNFTINHEHLAQVICKEWNDQTDAIDFTTMPMTRYQMTCLDVNEELRKQWMSEIVRYGKSDLLSYRAESPVALVKLQAEIWDPFLQFLEAQTQIKLAVTSGIIAVEQSQTVEERFIENLAKRSDQEILAIRRLTELTGSAALALCACYGMNDVSLIAKATFLDETYQAEQWGVDQEEAERRELIVHDITEALAFLAFQLSPSQ